MAFNARGTVRGFTVSTNVPDALCDSTNLAILSVIVEVELGLITRILGPSVSDFSGLIFACLFISLFPCQVKVPSLLI